jgi:hypothetical protein
VLVLAGLRKAWNAAKFEAAPWWTEVSKEAFNTGLDALARALKNWSGSARLPGRIRWDAAIAAGSAGETAPERPGQASRVKPAMTRSTATQRSST